MDEFHGILLPFLTSVLLIEELGGIDGEVGWLGWEWQKPPLGIPHEQP